MVRTKFMTVAVLALAVATVSVQAQQVIDATKELPAGAKAGECYARVMVPAVYTTETERVLRSEASERVEVIPARYEWAEERILVKEASTRIEVVPARYNWGEERVLVKPASKKLREVPAKYDWVEEQVLVKAATTVWKEGRGPIERLNNATGEIMCLVEEPAVYKTVRKRILKEPAKTVDVDIPAEYKTVKKQLLADPAKTRTVEIPAEYTTVKVRKMAEPPREKRIPIPAEYETVTKRMLGSEPRVEWREVLCETNLGSGVIASLQRALKNAGHNPGAVDGVIGRQTMEAIHAYQRENGMPSGALTMATLERLGVRVNN